MWVILGPLFGPCFANPMCPNNLAIGEAIVVKVRNPFSSEPSFDFIKLNLLSRPGEPWHQRNRTDPSHERVCDHWWPGGEGRRFQLVVLGWRRRTGRSLISQTQSREISRKLLRKLCRPEAVTPMEREGGENAGRDFSEHSTAQCANVPFTFIKAHYTVKK